MPQAEDIIFIAPLPSMTKRTRLAKMIPVVQPLGLRILFLGWQRSQAAIDNRIEGLTEKIILKGGGYGTRLARLMYLLWMPLVFYHVLRLGRRRRIFCLGWETAFPALLAAKLTRSTIIFDDADRFSLIIKLPGPLHRALAKLEQWASRQAFYHLIPGFARYEWRHERMILLINSPLQQDFAQAAENPLVKSSDDFTVFINGWMGKTRGIPILRQALQLVDFDSVKLQILAAGRIDCADGEALMAHEAVTFLGEMPQTQALACYPASDVVLTYYDPGISINRKAESNKWGDCVTFSVPFIVNCEVETADEFVQAGAAWSLAYHDAAGLASLLTKLAQSPSEVMRKKQALTSFQPRYLPFDTQFKKIVESLPQ